MATAEGKLPSARVATAAAASSHLLPLGCLGNKCWPLRSSVLPLSFLKLTLNCSVLDFLFLALFSFSILALAVPLRFDGGAAAKPLASKCR